MSTYGKKLLGMSQNKANLPRKPLNILTNLPNLISTNANYDIGTMKMFLDTLKTPAEMRGIECDERRSADVEVAEEALDMIQADETTDRPLAFGAVGFRTFGTSKDMPENLVEDGDDQAAVDANPGVSENLLGNCLTEEREDSQELLEPSLAAAIAGPSNEDTSKNVEEETPNIENVSVGKKGKKVKGTTTKKAREEVLKRNNEKKERSDRATKKAFNDNVNTVKVKLSAIQAKHGKLPDFAVFVKDSVHDPDVNNAAKSAGKYICFMKGNIADDFFSKKGISFHPDKFHLCKNELDMKEDQLLPYQKQPQKLSDAFILPEDPVVEVGQDASKQIDVSDEDTIHSGDESSSSDDQVDLYNTGNTARKVSWGAPIRTESESSEGGVLQFGRGAKKKTVSQATKDKKEQKKKHMKEATENSRVDILQNDDFGAQIGPGGSGTRGRGSARGASSGSRGRKRVATSSSRGSNKKNKKGGKTSRK